jgi:hypothetical protein
MDPYLAIKWKEIGSGQWSAQALHLADDGPGDPGSVRARQSFAAPPQIARDVEVGRLVREVDVRSGPRPATRVPGRLARAEQEDASASPSTLRWQDATLTRISPS